MFAGYKSCSCAHASTSRLELNEQVIGPVLKANLNLPAMASLLYRSGSAIPLHHRATAPLFHVLAKVQDVRWTLERLGEAMAGRQEKMGEQSLRQPVTSYASIL